MNICLVQREESWIFFLFKTIDASIHFWHNHYAMLHMYSIMFQAIENESVLVRILWWRPKGRKSNRTYAEEKRISDKEKEQCRLWKAKCSKLMIVQILRILMV